MTCHQESGGIDAIASLWGRLLDAQPWSSIFLTPAWQQTWWTQFGETAGALRLLTVGPAAQPLGIAPMVEDGETLTFIGGTDVFDYHDFIGGSPAFFHELVECIEPMPWRRMELPSIVAFSPTLEHLPALLRERGFSVEVEQEDVVPGVVLPTTWEEFLAGLRKKDRHELRRKLRRLEEAGEYRLVETTQETVEQDVELFHDVMKESREEKREFLGPEREEFFRRIVERTLTDGQLRLQRLEVDGEPIAAIMAFDHEGRRLLYNSGFRHAYGHLSAGLMLKALSIKDAIERGLTYFDFLRGPEPYKYHLGGRDIALYRLVVTR